MEILSWTLFRSQLVQHSVVFKLAMTEPALELEEW